MVGLLLMTGCGGSSPTAPDSGGAFEILVVMSGPLFPGDSRRATAMILAPESGLIVSRPTEDVTWATTDPSVVVIGPTGFLTAVAPGSARIVATREGVSGWAPVTVISEADLTGLDVSCPPSARSGERFICTAIGRLRTGAILLARPSWSSSKPEVVSIDSFGLARAGLEGQATISAVFHGQQGQAEISVAPLVDSLRATAAAEQGEFRPGTVATVFLIGSYSVASADTGRLSLEVTDQNGTVVAKGGPQVVARGGDSFAMNVTFTVPADSTEMCRTAKLEIGSVTLTAPDVGVPFRCITVRR